MVLPMATGIMLWTMYLPTDTGAPSLMPKGTCRRRQGKLDAQLLELNTLASCRSCCLTSIKLHAASQI